VIQLQRQIAQRALAQVVFGLGRQSQVHLPAGQALEINGMVIGRYLQAASVTMESMSTWLW
jgi:hypothetical protein